MSFCDRCKKEYGYFEMVDVKWNNKNKHYWVSQNNRIRPMKALFCKECIEVVEW